jgi:4-diphosphocytidyl-2-C-methyl-D-erythritol kinase
VEAVGRLLLNRLQEPAVRQRPELAEWLGRLASLGPAGCLVSGSGSTVFALCRGPAEARRVAAAIRPGLPAGARVIVARSCV